MVGSAAIFIVSVSFLFLFRDTIDDSIWFIPLLSGVIVGFLFLLAAVSKFIPQHPQAEEFRRARRKSKFIRNAIVFALCIPFIVAATLTPRYVQLIVTEEEWSRVFVEEQYQGKCYTKEWNLSRIKCIGTGFDWPLEKLLWLMSKPGLLNILR